MLPFFDIVRKKWTTHAVSVGRLLGLSQWKDRCAAICRTGTSGYHLKQKKEENSMLHIGCHLSSGPKDFEAMGKEALKIGADTFQFFTRNPRGGAAKALDTEDASRLQALLETNYFCAARGPCAVYPKPLRCQ